MPESPSIVFAATGNHVVNEIWTHEARRRADELGFVVSITEPAPRTDAEWAEVLASAEAIITTWGSPRLTADVLSRNETLRFVGHAAGSLAPVVSPELSRRKIRLSTANREMANSVANWCLMMTMVGARRLLEYAQFGRGHPMVNDTRALPRDPRQLTVGVWGFGDVARAFIPKLQVVAPRRVIVCDDYLTQEEACRIDVVKVDLETLFAQSDILQLLQSLTDTSKGTVGAELLALIRDGAVLVNAGRAHLTREDALLAELRKERFTGIFDVHHTEPLPTESPFRQLPNVILTPHCAGREGRTLYARLMLEEFARLQDGRPLLYEVDPARAKAMTDPRLTRG